MTGTLPLLYSQSHHLDPQGLAGTQARAPLASLTGKEEKEALEEPCRQRPTVAGLAHSQDQRVMLPGSAAWLPCRLSVPGAGPQPTCSCPNVRMALELRIPSGTLQLALFNPTSGSGPRTIG